MGGMEGEGGGRKYASKFKIFNQDLVLKCDWINDQAYQVASEAECQKY